MKYERERSGEKESLKFFFFGCPDEIFEFVMRIWPGMGTGAMMTTTMMVVVMMDE